jgi:hypothetical protein
MKNYLQWFTLFITIPIYALPIEKKFLRNNKEMISRQLSKIDYKQISHFEINHPKQENLHVKLENVLYHSLKTDTDNYCEVEITKHYKDLLMQENLVSKQYEVPLTLKYLRSKNSLDDILLKILNSSLNLLSKIEIKNKYPQLSRPRNINILSYQHLKLEKIYQSFTPGYKEETRCLENEFEKILSQMPGENRRSKLVELEKINWLALHKKIIDLKGFNQLDATRENAWNPRRLSLNRYMEILLSTKDRLTQKPETLSTNRFSTKIIDRRNAITQREYLYNTFNSTQITLLAEILKKTAQRMDATQTTIHWDYADEENGEIYILSPMEQYRIALKMLRKDFAQAMRSSTFTGFQLEYEHLISAGYETGLINSQDLDLVIRFEQFWNPKISRMSSYTQFITSIFGSTVYYLPPPWNLVGAFALVLTQSRLTPQRVRPETDENWNIII